jgi:hypothetical protein
VPAHHDLGCAFLVTGAESGITGRPLARTGDDSDEAGGRDLPAASIPDLDRDVEDPDLDVSVLAQDGVLAITPAMDVSRLDLGFVAPFDERMEVVRVGIRLAE